TPSPATAGAGDGGRAPGGSTAASSLTLPSFGAMLPVKSLGAIYTLRSSGGVVRFEVAYEKRGRGWVIPKGTEIVGVVRGSDRDRAFITMTGMIDPQTGKFVKLAGDLLGADGATGVRGERKRLSSRWASFFGKLRDAGLSSIGAAAGAIGRGPIIITDVYRRSSSPLTSELNGVLGSDRDGFVLIKAGTTGYIYITQMPDEIHGLQELASLSRDTIGSLADTARQRAATGLSEDKLAEILTRGDAEEIRRAFADMTPEMRRVAEAFLKDAEAR
ncbi:MAG: TrbI/VirB10 family protein, partial [Rubrivivax sp.]|nr:TrbI/VirB10 family protein [Pyrinomonadaceae bacterium]